MALFIQRWLRGGIINDSKKILFYIKYSNADYFVQESCTRCAVMWKWQKEHLNNLKQNFMLAEAH